MIAGSSDDICLALVELSKDFGGLRAVDRVNLTVRRGERRALIGPNGAGKTTLFNVISGELPATTGQVVLFGRDITRLPPERRVALGLSRTYQIMNLFPSLTVLENVLLGIQGLRRSKFVMHRSLHAYSTLFDRARQLLESVGLWEKRDLPAISLAYGEQRQLELVLALAGDPRLLLLDEPTAGLSPGEARVLTGMLQKLDPSITMLLIEHDMDVAFDVAERVTVLHVGRVLAEGTKDEVKRNSEVQKIYLGVSV